MASGRIVASAGRRRSATVGREREVPLDGGQAQQCGWLSDRYGLVWQVVPLPMFALIQGPEAAKAERAMQAMLQMVKLDLGELQRAYDGA